MNLHKSATAAFLLLFALSLGCTAAYADEFDQAMRLTFSKDVEIPGTVLPAGTYWFMRPGQGGGPNAATSRTLEVRSEDKSNVIATLNTLPERQIKAHDHIVVTFAEQSTDTPQTLLGVTYPGRQEGHAFDFQYPEERRKVLAEYRRVHMAVDNNGVMTIDTSMPAENKNSN